MTNVLPPLRDKQYGGAWSIHDPSTAEFLQNISHDQGNTEKFVNDYAPLTLQLQNLINSLSRKNNNLKNKKS